MSSQIQWLTAAPLWGELAAGADKGPFRSPALLRFATDQFMEDLQGVLASQTPGDIANYVAQAEAWWNPAVGLTSPGSTTTAKTGKAPAGATDPPLLKFFQPVHSRFYLVSASLVCRLPGLPDHTVKGNQGESTAFVLRKLSPKDGLTKVDLSVFDSSKMDEYAWIPGDLSGWVLASATGLAAGEEKLPTFALPYGTNGSRRRIYSGVIPVSHRQAYVAGQKLIPPTDNKKPPSPETVEDPRTIDFQRKVLDPWADLANYRDQSIQSNPPLTKAALDQMTTGVAQASALVLIDFATFLQQQLPNVWDAIKSKSEAPVSGKPKQLALYRTLRDTTVVNYIGSKSTTLADAITTASDHDNDFEREPLDPTKPPSLPDNYLGPLLVVFYGTGVSGYSGPDPEADLTALIGRDTDQTRPIQAKVEAALLEYAPTAPASNVRPPAKNVANPQGDDWFIVRCVYLRPQCGRGALPVMSEPSRPFQLASYFDPDAPARAIQVALPVDTTPAALRRYDKNVAFMISDQLGQQMSRVKGLKQLMDGDLADPNGLGLGMICSLSIPIITICAFIVLMIFLILLNLIFWWLPFFKICFPLPSFKAKGS